MKYLKKIFESNSGKRISNDIIDAIDILSNYNKPFDISVFESINKINNMTDEEVIEFCESVSSNRRENNSDEENFMLDMINKFSKDFSKTNEELNLKKAFVGGALAASLASCEPSNNTGYTSYNNKPIEQTQVNQSKELSNSFVMDEELITFGMDMSISTGGKVEQRTFKWGSKFEYFDENGNKKATAKEEVFTFGTIINITDENGKKIGSVEQEIMESLFSIYSKYSIKDASGRVIAKSDKLKLLTTSVDIKDFEGGTISMDKALLSIGDSWDVNINSNIDKRLVVFIPPFISLSQSKRK